jgi:hypothetical protein
MAMSLATLLVIPVEAAARSNGVGFGTRHHFSGSRFMQRHRARNTAPYAGYIAGLTPGIDDESAGYVIALPQSPQNPPHVLTCHRSRETIAVPVEGGGDQQVRITRC